jgi:hypothetical protein
LKKNYLAILILGLLVISHPLFNSYVFENNFERDQKPPDNNVEVIINTLSIGAIQQVEWDELSCQGRLSFLERLIMLNYVPQIKEAVDKYYEDIRGFDLEKITDVRVVAPYEYEVTIQISTYVGAHNPPKGIDVVTIRFKKLSDGVVVNYQHIDEY